MDRYFLESLFKYYRKNFAHWGLWILAAGYVVRALYSIVLWTIATNIRPEQLSLSAKNKMQYWKYSLKLAVTVMKDLLSGKIGKEQKRCHTGGTW